MQCVEDYEELHGEPEMEFKRTYVNKIISGENERTILKVKN